MSDEKELIQRACTGDKQAFTSLVRQYQNRIFGFIMRMTANKEASLDLTQDTFLAAWQNLNGFSQESPFSSWLFQIAANKTKNMLKKSNREKPLPDGFDLATDNADNPDELLQKKEYRRRLLIVVASLPEKQKTAFNLRYFNEMKFFEVAEIMEVSVSTAKTNYAEAIKKLKKAMREHYEVS